MLGLIVESRRKISNSSTLLYFLFFPCFFLPPSSPFLFLIKRFPFFLPLSVCLYGGVSKFEQKKELQQGVQVVVATPGRLMDLIEEGVCSLEKITYLVLDEADRMLDMGFEREVKAILSKIPNKERQTLMFSATWPKAIQDLSAQYLNDPVKVTVGSIDLAASHSVKQIVEVIEQNFKESRLEQLLNKYHASRTNRVLVFALYKKVCHRHFRCRPSPSHL